MKIIYKKFINLMKNRLFKFIFLFNYLMHKNIKKKFFILIIIQ